MPRSDIILKVRNTTPLLVGWYRPEKQDPAGLRSTELKGIWRWWARAFVAGALYDHGYLLGEYRDEVYLAPRKEEVDVISYFVGHILGLGLSSDRKAEASRFTIFVESLDKLVPLTYRQRQTPYQRINLLTIKRTIEGIDPGKTFKIHIVKEFSKYRDAEELAVKIFIVALQFMGVGKGSRRGLGSLDICSISGITAPNNIRELVREIYEQCVRIVEKYSYEFGLTKLRQRRSFEELPPLPVISKASFQNVHISQMYVLRNANDNHFVDIHNFFLRSERCRKIFNNPVCYDDLRKNLYAWIMGLPRGQKGTGYHIMSSEVHRRASPVTIAFHRRENIFGSGVFMALFISGDWPKHLRWGASKDIEVNRNTILNAYVVLLSELNTYLRKIGLNLSDSRIWP